MALWLSVVGLLVLALAFVVPPLLRAPAAAQAGRQAPARRVHADRLAQIEADVRAGVLAPEDRAQAVEEVQRQLLEEEPPGQGPPPGARRWMQWAVAGALSVMLPACAFLLYLRVGNPAAYAEQALAGRPEGAQTGGDVDLERLVARLAQRLREQPDDVAGWIMLARSYEFLQRYDDAVAAYRRAMALAPKQPQLLADYADALGSARGGDLGGPVHEAVAAALALDPDHPKAMALAGAAAYQRGEHAAARGIWERLLTLLPPDSEALPRVRADLARLDATGAAPTPPAALPRQVAGTVAIAEALRDRVQPDDTVFVIARAAGAGRMPVAVLRLRVKDLPMAFVLDDSHVMSADAPISRFAAVTLEVRVSRAGQAQAKAGDLTGTATEVAVGREGVRLLADQIIR